MIEVPTKILSFLLKNTRPGSLERGRAGARRIRALLLLAAGLLALAGCSFYQPPFEFSNPNDLTIQLSTTAGHATITVDGDPADWAGIGAVISDPQGDVPKIAGETGLDAKAVYLAMDANYLYWRIDVWDGPISGVAFYDLSIGTPDRIAGTDLHLRCDAGIESSFTDEIDEAGNWLSQSPVAGVTIARGTVLEG